MLCQDFTERKISSEHILCSSKAQSERHQQHVPVNNETPLSSSARSLTFCLTCQIHGLSTEYLTISQSKFETLHLKYNNKGLSDSIGWGLSNWVPPTPVLRWRCWAAILPSVLELCGYTVVFSEKRKGRQKIACLKLHIKAERLPLKWDGGAARALPLGRGSNQNSRAFRGCTAWEKVLSKPKFRRKACFSSIWRGHRLQNLRSLEGVCCPVSALL